MERSDESGEGLLRWLLGSLPEEGYEMSRGVTLL